MTTSTLSTDRLDHALAYARLGWRIFPAHSAHDGRCSCGDPGCRSIGKHPRLDRWQIQATNDGRRIRLWWEDLWPGANLALVLGDGRLDLEDDPRHDGDRHLPRLEAILGQLPDTVSWLSGGGGTHRLYTVPPGVRVRCRTDLGRDLLGLRPDQRSGVDCKADGGYAILPPSNHANGNQYRFGNLTPSDIECAPLPETWLHYLTQDPKTLATPADPAGSEAVIAEGRRNSTLTRYAGHLRRCGMDDEEITAGLSAINARRCRPPLDDAEVRGIAASVARYEPDQVTQAVVEDWAATTLGTKATASQVTTPRALFTLETEADPNILIRHRWLCRSGSCLLVGQTGIGKSSFAVQAMIAWALGQPLFGITPVRPLRSLIIQAENDTGDLAEMFQGIVEGLACHDDLNTLDERIRFVSETAICGDAFHPYARSLITEHQPDLVWIDPLFAFLGGNVSDQAIVSMFLRNGLGAIAQDTGIAWMIVHHTNKPAKDAKGSPVASDDAYLGAGSAELANWARATMTLRDVGDGIFELRAGKRGKRSGLLDSSGQPSAEVFLRHGSHGICWERAERPDRDRRNDDLVLAQDILTAMDAGRIYSRLDLRDLAQEHLGVSKSAVLTAGRRANRVYRLLLDLTRIPADPDRHRRPASSSGEQP